VEKKAYRHPIRRTSKVRIYLVKSPLIVPSEAGSQKRTTGEFSQGWWKSTCPRLRKKNPIVGGLRETPQKTTQKGRSHGKGFEEFLKKVRYKRKIKRSTRSGYAACARDGREGAFVRPGKRGAQKTKV